MAEGATKVQLAGPNQATPRLFLGIEPQGKCCFVSVDGVELLEEMGQ